MKTEIKFIVGVISVWIVVATTANGQTPASDLKPEQPILPRALDGSWTIAYKYRSSPTTSSTSNAKISSNKPQDQTSSIRIDKKGTSYHVVETKTSGRHAEHWSIKGTEIYKDTDGDAFVKVAKGSPFYIDFSKVDFDELSWVGMDNYKGVEVGPDGGKLFVFEVKNKDRRQTEQERTATGDLNVMVEKLGLVDEKGDKKQAIAKMMDREYGDSVAHLTLDVLTQLPVQYEDGKSTRSYTYTAEPLAIPPELTKFFTKMDEQTKKATVPAPPP